MDLNQMVKGVTLSKVCSVKADKDSDESKQITLKVKFEGVPLQAVFEKAIAQTVIQWQNGPGRRQFNQWKSGQIVEVMFKSPAMRTAVDPMQQFIAEAKADGIDVTDDKALAKYVMKRINS